MTAILFPSEPFDPRAVDPDFGHEREVAQSLGFATGLLDHTAWTRGAVDDAVARVRCEGLAIYRGWMVTAEQYSAVFEALRKKGVSLINSPEEYAFCHHLPASYGALTGLTPHSVWIPVEREPDMTRILDVCASLGKRAVIVKDYVKSQKHYWSEACFIPDATDRARAEAIVARFLELQGSELTGGLVFREYVPLKIAGHHPKSGMPLAAEFRSFWVDGKLLLSHKYWADLTDFDTELPSRWMQDIVSKIQSRFFTMDVALQDDGNWTVVELGDGQVAGLPSPSLARSFFQRLEESIAVAPPAGGG